MTDMVGMRRFLPLLPFLLPSLAAPAAAQEAAKPAPPQHAFLWKVEREGLATSWLFGTIHVPDDRVNALHPEVKAALEGADAFYGELALDDTGDMEKKLMEAGTYPEDRKLQDAVPPELWKRLDERLREHGLTAGMLNRFKPFMVSMTLAQLEMLPLVTAGKKALDERIYLVAKAKGKEVGGVEQVEEQIQALAHTLTEEESVAQLAETLDDMDVADERGVSDLQRMLGAWLSGSERYLLAIAMESLDLEDPVERRIHEALLIRRNRHMAERAAAKMKAAPEKRFVFAFGTLHYVGEGSVVELLRKDGFTVTRVAAPSPEEEEAILAADPWLEPHRKLAPEPAAAGAGE